MPRIGLASLWMKLRASIFALPLRLHFHQVNRTVWSYLGRPHFILEQGYTSEVQQRAIGFLK